MTEWVGLVGLACFVTGVVLCPVVRLMAGFHDPGEERFRAIDKRMESIEMMAREAKTVAIKSETSIKEFEGRIDNLEIDREATADDLRAVGESFVKLADKLEFEAEDE